MGTRYKHLKLNGLDYKYKKHYLKYIHNFISGNITVDEFRDSISLSKEEIDEVIL